MNRGIRGLIAAAPVMLVSVLVVQSGRVAVSQQGTSMQTADEVFQSRCSTCHAEHGEGSEAGASLNVPDLRSRQIQEQEDSQLRQVIKEGKGDMPMFKRDFSDAEVNQLIKLVRSFARLNNAQAQGK